MIEIIDDTRIDGTIRLFRDGSKKSRSFFGKALAGGLALLFSQGTGDAKQRIFSVPFSPERPDRLKNFLKGDR